MSAYAWHFVALRNGAPVLRDGRPMPGVGVWLEETGPIVICQRGLHASYRARDALDYANPREPLAACLVEVDGIVTEHSDKFVCSRRRVLAWAPCDDVLRLFAREAALSVLHLWAGEVPAVVREYLETGNEEIRAAAAAAFYAARADDAAAYAAADAAAAAFYAARADDAAFYAARAAYAAADAAAARAATILDLNTQLESMLLAEIGWTP